MQLFNENMTYPEAQKAFFKAIEGKNEAEKEEILEEYRRVLPAITKKELEEDNCLTSYKVK